jgi:imidazolonepropionase-like amidohydrolase
MLIKNGKIFTMGERDFEKGDILIEAGKIVKVSEEINLEKIHKNDEYIIDAKGAWIIPGMIDAHCHLGLIEENMGGEGVNVNETSDPVTPHIRAIDGINPMDGGFFKAKKAGITTVVTGPGSTNVIGGEFAAIKTHGIVIDDMIVKAPIAMKVAFGENPKRIYKSKNKMPMTRMATAALLRDTLVEAQNYLAKKKRAEEKGDYFDKKLKYEALIPVLERRVPLKAHAHRADDILTSIRIAKEFDLKLTIEHCTEGHLITEHIKKSGYDVIAGPSLSFNSKIEVKNKSFKTSVELIKAGVKTAIMTDHPVIPIEQLPLAVAFAMREGLSFHEALRTVTIDAAEIIGIADRVGSLEEGKDADLVILSGSPFELTTKTLYTIINGEVVYKD